MRLVRPIAVVEETAAHERDAKDVEVAGEATQKSAVPAALRLGRESAHVLHLLRQLLRRHQQEHAVGQAAVHRHGRGRGDVFDAGNRAEAIEDAA